MKRSKLMLNGFVTALILALMLTSFGPGGYSLARATADSRAAGTPILQGPLLDARAPEGTDQSISGNDPISPSLRHVSTQPTAKSAPNGRMPTIPTSTQVLNIFQTDISGPVGSGSFGKQVVVLSNGNIVVADPDYSSATESHVGAVYLYDGDTLELISMLTGSHANDQIGFGYAGVTPGVTVLSNGNYVVSSPEWNGEAGAVTWVNGFTGISGTVSAANSLVGGYLDLVGAGVTALNNGNYVIYSPYWDDPNHSPYNPLDQFGAVTWANGSTGITGTISAANSLVGGEYHSFVGNSVYLLSNGNFLIYSLNAGKGAVTWGSAAAGLPTGTLSAANSLVGSKFDDNVGGNVVTLTNGNYVIDSPTWDNGAVIDAGAVTWGNGASGTIGVVSAANSLVGTRAYDAVGYGGNGPGVIPLSNGNYVVVSYIWDSPSATDVGAITWANGATGRSGPVSGLNSLVGKSDNDYLGYLSNCYCSGVTALSNGQLCRV